MLLNIRYHYFHSLTQCSIPFLYREFKSFAEYHVIFADATFVTTGDNTFSTVLKMTVFWYGIIFWLVSTFL